MLKSLQLYAKYLFRTLSVPERKLLTADFRRQGMVGKDFNPALTENAISRQESLEKAVRWLLVSQKATVDDGFCSYHLANGWSSSYPETTGYIIPTLINCSRRNDVPGIMLSALKAADFLVRIQKESGGWQGGRVNENRPEIVFNTGQVIRGMTAAFEVTGDKKYLNAAVRAGNWLASIQHPEGFWKTHALMEQARVYDTFVDAPMIHLSSITGDALYRESAVRNLEWVITAKMNPNGWFEDCDNTIKRNDKPILHTIAYTLDGLLDSGKMLGNKLFTESALKGSEKLRDIFLSQGILQGRYDRNWNGSEYFICTGGAQMAIVWLKLYREGYGPGYLTAARKMISLLVFIQSRPCVERAVTLGAIPGSFPLWGRYEPFAYPNWATKFFCDALLMEKEIEG